MKAYWAKGRKGALEPADNDQPTPIDDGRFCRVIDLENGEIPVPTYGRTPDEVLAKIERTGMHARLHLASSQAPRSGQPAAPKPAAATRRLAMTPDEQMRATLDLATPAAAPAAVKALLEEATGIDLDEMAARAFADRAQRWAATHPELKNVAFNTKLITDNARMRVGGDLRKVTTEILEAVYQELSAGGYLLTEDHSNANPSQPALPVQPGQNPAQGTRQTDPAFATSHRLNRTGTANPPQWKPKYTREQIDRMPMKESEKLLRARDKDYEDSVNYWYPPRQARA